MEYDRRRLIKESLLERVITTTGGYGRPPPGVAGLGIFSRLTGIGAFPRPPYRHRRKQRRSPRFFRGIARDADQQQVIEVLAAVLRGDAESVRRH